MQEKIMYESNYILIDTHFQEINKMKNETMKINQENDNFSLRIKRLENDFNLKKKENNEILLEKINIEKELEKTKESFNENVKQNNQTHRNYQEEIKKIEKILEEKCEYLSEIETKFKDIQGKYNNLLENIKEKEQFIGNLQEKFEENHNKLIEETEKNERFVKGFDENKGKIDNLNKRMENLEKEKETLQSEVNVKNKNYEELLNLHKKNVEEKDKTNEIFEEKQKSLIQEIENLKEKVINNEKCLKNERNDNLNKIEKVSKKFKEQKDEIQKILLVLDNFKVNFNNLKTFCKQSFNCLSQLFQNNSERILKHFHSNENFLNKLQNNLQEKEFKFEEILKKISCFSKEKDEKKNNLKKQIILFSNKNEELSEENKGLKNIICALENQVGNYEEKLMIINQELEKNSDKSLSIIQNYEDHLSKIKDGLHSKHHKKCNCEKKYEIIELQKNIEFLTQTVSEQNNELIALQNLCKQQQLQLQDKNSSLFQEYELNILNLEKKNNSLRNENTELKRHIYKIEEDFQFSIDHNNSLKHDFDKKLKQKQDCIENLEKEAYENKKSFKVLTINIKELEEIIANLQDKLMQENPDDVDPELNDKIMHISQILYDSPEKIRKNINEKSISPLYQSYKRYKEKESFQKKEMMYSYKCPGKENYTNKRQFTFSEFDCSSSLRENKYYLNK